MVHVNIWEIFSCNCMSCGERIYHVHEIGGEVIGVVVVVRGKDQLVEEVGLRERDGEGIFTSNVMIIKVVVKMKFYLVILSPRLRLLLLL